MTQTLQESNWISSEVDTTLTVDCFDNSLSLDHNGQLKAKAKARYSTSFGSGDIFSACDINFEYTADGKILILDLNREMISSISSLLHFDFSLINGEYFSNSWKAKLGEIKSKSNEKISSCVAPSFAIKAAKRMLASTTINIQPLSASSLTWRSWTDLRSFLPSSKASCSVNLDFDTIALNKISWDNFNLIASLATSDQLISLHSSICTFISSGMAKVNVDMVNTSHNTLDTPLIFKPFGGIA